MCDYRGFHARSLQFPVQIFALHMVVGNDASSRSVRKVLLEAQSFVSDTEEEKGVKCLVVGRVQLESLNDV